MITGFIVLLGCQLLGEFAVRALGVPIPGPVVGMVLLFVVLLIRRPERTAGVVRAADGLLRHLQLLFIPAGAGIVAYLSVVGASWLPVARRVGDLLVGGADRHRRYRGRVASPRVLGPPTQSATRGAAGRCRADGGTS